jgi:hypothetical protein
MNLFMRITPLHQLDAVLNYIKAKDELIAEYDELFGSTLSFWENYNSIHLVLEKLERDKYITPLTYNHDGSTNYRLTIEGYMFEGYVKEKQAKDNQDVIKTQNEIQKVSRDIWILRGTWFAGIAAWLLLLYYLITYFYPPSFLPTYQIKL